jgi:uncharacterized membrane protein
MVGIRRTTGRDLKVQTEGGQLLTVIAGSIVGGVLILYLVFVEGQSLLLVPAYVLATVVGVVVWRRHWHQQRTTS